MKKTNRKGFTIVELVIVIAVIAILAAVLIPVFSNVIKKANQSSDTQLVRNLNTAVSTGLASEGKTKCSTAHQAIEYAKDGGYDVAKIVAKSDNKISWSKDTGLFVLIDTNTGKAIYPTQNGVGELVVSGNEVNYFLICSSMPTSTSYSIYAGINWAGEKVTLNGIGFDAGDNTDAIKTVTYTNTTSAKDIIIRTNSEKTTLNVNAPADTIKHYNAVGIVNITRTANASYHEYGTANFVQNASGRVVAENGGFIKTCVLAAKGIDATLVAVAQEDGGEIENCYATTNAVANANNGESVKNVQLVVAPVADEGNVLAEGKTTEQITSIVERKKDEVAAEANNHNYATLTGDARICGNSYTTLQDAINAVNDGDIIVLLKDVTYAYTLKFDKAYNVTIDFSGHKLAITNGSAGAGGGRAFRVDNKLSVLNVKNGQIDGRNYTETGLLNPKTSTAWGNGSVGGCFRIEKGTVNLSNLIMYNNDGWGSAVSCRSIDATANLTKCTIDSTLGACIEISNGDIKDCTFIQRNQGNTWQHLATCIGACYGGVVNIYDSSTEIILEEGEEKVVFTEGKGTRSIYVFNTGSTVNIYGGKFSGITNSIRIDYPNNPEGAGDVAIVNVYDGIFDGPITVAKSGPKEVQLNVYGGTFSVDVSQYRK